MDANTPWTQSKFYTLYDQHPWTTKHGPQKRLRHNFILEHDKDTNTYYYKEGVTSFLHQNSSVEQNSLENSLSRIYTLTYYRNSSNKALYIPSRVLHYLK